MKLTNQDIIRNIKMDLNLKLRRLQNSCEELAADLVRLSAEIESQSDKVVLNSCGIIQTRGLRIDQDCAAIMDLKHVVEQLEHLN